MDYCKLWISTIYLGKSGIPSDNLLSSREAKREEAKRGQGEFCHFSHGLQGILHQYGKSFWENIHVMEI
jgi:hypothetical protein